MVFRWMLAEHRMMWQFDWQIMSSVSGECWLGSEENESEMKPLLNRPTTVCQEEDYLVVLRLEKRIKLVRIKTIN